MSKEKRPSQFESLISELHSRPFLAMEAGSRVSYLVVKHAHETAMDDSLNELGRVAKHLGIKVPKGARSYFWHDAKEFIFKWERHTEFSTYLIFERSPKGQPFDASSFERFPQNWLKGHSSNILASAIIEITQPQKEFLKVIEDFRGYFAKDSVSAAQVLEGAAAIASDFMVDENDHMRLLIIPSHDIGKRRLGRVVQRLVEVETYIVASMQGLSVAHQIARQLPEFEERILPIISSISSNKLNADGALQSLLEMAAKIEQIISENSFRFGASEAYSDLVDQRISLLRETRLGGFQMFSEFTLRRYEPGMRTISSTWTRLTEFSERVERAATLLRTKVEVANSEGQRALLKSLDRRSEAQYRLQETVEGLSVVAISYYAVSLVGYLVAPLAKAWGIDKTWLMAASVLPVLLLVWLFIHGIKKHVVKDKD